MELVRLAKAWAPAKAWALAGAADAADRAEAEAGDAREAAVVWDVAAGRVECSSKAHLLQIAPTKAKQNKERNKIMPSIEAKRLRKLNSCSFEFTGTLTEEQ